VENSFYSLDVCESISDLSESSVELLRNQSSPFLNYDWFHAFSSHVSHSLGKPKWLILSESGEVVALLPMIEEQRGIYLVLRSMTNYYSPYFDLISSPGTSRSILLEHIFGAARELFSVYDIIEFLPTTEEVLTDFSAVFGQNGWYCHKYEHTINFQETNIQDFGSYWNERPSRLQSTVKRKQKKLNGISHKYKICIIDLTDEALAEYHYTYFRSWKVTEPFPAFID